LLLPTGSMFSMMVAKGTTEEHFQECGKTHFSTRKQVEDVFSPFSAITLDKTTKTMNNQCEKQIYWVIRANK